MIRLSFGRKTWGFLTNPVNTFNNVEPEPLAVALQYFAIWAVVYAILQTVMLYTVNTGFFQSLEELFGVSADTIYGINPVVFGVLSVLGTFAGIFVGGSWTHLFVLAFGGRRGYRNTIKALAYGYTPALLLGWIPVVGWLSSIWALVLEIIGIRQLHGISTGRAVGAVLVSMAAVAVVAVVIVIGVVLSLVIQATA
jgi:hypothetical protein